MSRGRVGATLRCWLVLLALGSVPTLVTPLPGQSATLTTASDRSEHIHIGVYVLDVDPLTNGGSPLSQAQGWNDPFVLQAHYLADVITSSGGIASQRLVRVSQIRDFPVQAKRFRFTDTTYRLSRRQLTDLLHGIDRLRSVAEHRVRCPLGKRCEALRRGRVDEVWLGAGHGLSDPFSRHQMV